MSGGGEVRHHLLFSLAKVLALLAIAAVPAQHGLGLDDHKGASPAGPQPRQPSPQDSIRSVQSGSHSRTPLQYPQLMVKSDDLDLQFGLAPETRPQPDQQGNHDAMHGPRAYQFMPLSSIFSTRTEFTIGTGAARLEATGTLTGTFQSVWLRKYSMIVYLGKVDGGIDFKPSTRKPTIDQKNKRFVPHVLPVVQGTTIRYLNHDDTKHNVYFIQPDGKKVSLGTGRVDWSKDHMMDQAGVYVHHCNMHDEMTAYVFVGNPYYALVKKQASRTPAEFKIEGVPAGDYELHVWCEKFYRQKGHKFNRVWEVSIKLGEETNIDVKP